MGIPITLSNISNAQQITSASSVINNNNAAIESALSEALSTTNQTSNSMNTNLDMNSNQILNLPAPVSANSPARLQDVISNPTLVLTIPPIGTSGATVPLLNTNVTFSGNNTYSGTSNFTGAITLGNTITASGAGTWTGIQSFNAGITSNITTPLVQGLNLFQVTSGGSVTASTNLNQIVLIESVSASGGSIDPAVQGWSFLHDINGGRGGRTSLEVSTTIYNPMTDGTNPFITALGAYIQTAIPSTVTNAELFALNPQVVLFTGATGWPGIRSVEIDIAVQTGASTDYMSGLAIVQLDYHAVHASVAEAALVFSNQPGAIGWNNLILVGSFGGGSTPLTSTGTVMGTIENPTFNTGIDFSGATINTWAFVSPGFGVTGLGQVQGSSILSGTYVKHTPTVYASLPTASTVGGSVMCITDSNTNTWGATVAGGGSDVALVFSNGANWTVIGK